MGPPIPTHLIAPETIQRASIEHTNHLAVGVGGEGGRKLATGRVGGLEARPGRVGRVDVEDAERASVTIVANIVVEV